MTWRSQYAPVAAIALVVATGCAARGPAAGNEAPPGTAIRVVAVERVYGDLAGQLGGDAVSVYTLLNSPTADPHAYEPTTDDASAIASADIVIENGLGYDAFVDKLLAASPKAGRIVIAAGSLRGHAIGDNPHVWYEAATLDALTLALSGELSRRVKPDRRAPIAAARNALRTWIATFTARVRALGKAHAGKRVAITEPVFDYVLKAAGLAIATPTSFSHAIEEGNDPAPQDVDAMRALLSSNTVAAFVYNSQTVEPSTESLLATARASGLRVVPVTETLPAGKTTQQWIDGEVLALDRAL